MMKTAEGLKKMSEKLNIPLVYKSSFQKDNRSDVSFYQGPGLEEGLRLLEHIKKEFGLPVLSDIHYPDQVKPAAEVLDIIQIPAYLCMQTTLVVEAAKTGKIINLKHGQFLAPENMIKPVKKIESVGNRLYKNEEVERKEALSKVYYNNATNYFISRGITGPENEDGIAFFEEKINNALNVLPR